MAYILVVAAGVFVASALQWVFMSVFLEPSKVVREAHRRVEAFRARSAEEPADVVREPRWRWQFEHLGTGLQGWVGAMEIVLYSTSIVFEHPEFIGIWFATKYVSSYKTWAREPVGRTFYNRSLFGSGLNILIGFFTGRIALWAIKRMALR